jgi:hypothetical protein
MAIAVLEKPEPGKDISNFIPLDNVPVGLFGSRENLECQKLAAGAININDTESWQGEWSCTQGEDGVRISTTIKIAVTQSHDYGVVFVYSATDNQTYDRHLPEANDAIHTLSIQNAQIVPEMPSTALLPLLSAAILLVLIIRRKLNVQE